MAGVLVVGAAEPEIQSWLRAAGHAPRAVRRAAAAGPALEEEPVDLVIVDRDSSGLDAPEVCRRLRDDPRLGDAWVLAITVAAKGRMADSVLDAGADDYLHRPFTRAELIARARAGLRAAEQRANDRLLRTLMENVPGRDLPLRLARRLRPGGDQRRDRADLGLPAAELPRLAEAHDPLDRPPRRRRRRARDRLALDRGTTSRSCSSTGSCAPTARCAGCSTAASPCPGRAGGCGWTARCSTSPSAARPRRRCWRTRSRRRARPSCAPRASASWRPPTRRGARSSATCTTARSSGSSRSCSTSRSRAAGWPRTRRRWASSSSGWGTSSRRPRPSCASSPAASIPRC